MSYDDVYDTACVGCEIAQVDYDELEKITQDLAMLVTRLSRNLKLIDPDNIIATQAMEYLIANKFIGSPLRDNTNHANNLD